MQQMDMATVISKWDTTEENYVLQIRGYKRGAPGNL